MQGALVNGFPAKTKKELKEAVANDPASVDIEATSPLGGEYSGPADALPVGTAVNVVGPDPYRNRKWYATVARTPQGKVVVT